MPRWPSLIGVCALVAVIALTGSPGVAIACACGGVLSSDPALRVADEMALITGDGSTETVVMRLNLSTTADEAALVVPTPAPATVTAAPQDRSRLSRSASPPTNWSTRCGCRRRRKPRSRW